MPLLLFPRPLGAAGDGSLSGSVTVTFTPAGALTGTSALAGAATVTFTPAGALTGDSALSGAVTVTFTPSGDLDAGAPPVVPDTAQTPAGRGRRKRRYLVEIDGREFEFDNPGDALALLEKARAMAVVAAERQAELAIESGLPKARRIGRAEQVKAKVPSINGSPELQDEITRTKERIRQIYRDAAMAAELRILMALEAEKDDEEAILLSL